MPDVPWSVDRSALRELTERGLVHRYAGCWRVPRPVRACLAPIATALDPTATVELHRWLALSDHTEPVERHHHAVLAEDLQLATSELPSPSADALVVYLLGPGFGESVVIGLPCGRWLVVDTCRHDGACLPLALLRERGVSTVACLFVTHADLDHIEGLDELFDGLEIQRLVRFPAGNSLTALLAAAVRNAPGETRLRAVRDGLAAIERFERRGRLVEATYDTRALAFGEVSVDVLSPLETDRAVALRQISRALTEDGRLDSVSDLSVIKVAHHGSRGAWSSDAWDLHGEVPVALLAPWRRGGGLLPDPEVFEALVGRARRIGLTWENDDLVARRSRHWTPPASDRQVEGPPAVAVVLHRAGSIDVHTANGAGAWSAERPAPPR